MAEGSHTTEFSVVIATRDRCGMLQEAVNAALDQTHAAAELIVVDDGSTDDTQALLAHWTSGRLRSIRTTGLGVCAARNLGLRAAMSDWIVFLDDDDVPLPTWLETLASKVRPEVCLVSAPVIIRWSDGREIVRRPQPEPFSTRPVLLLPGAFAVRRAALLAVGGFLDGLTFSEHTELGMRLVPSLEADLSIAVHDEPVLVMRRETNRRSAVGRHHALLRVMAEHHEKFEADPERHSRWLSIAGVDAFRSDERGTARRLLAKAFFKRPSSRTLARLTAALVPGLGRRLWRDGSDPPGQGYEASSSQG